MLRRKLDQIQSEVDKLLDNLDLLKTDNTQTNVDLGLVLTSDEPEKATQIYKKIAELMDINKTIETMELKFTYMHKRVCREFIVYTEKDSTIKICLVNHDNYLYHGEFSVPGFDEVDNEFDTQTGEPILSKEIAVFDRSIVHRERRFAFLQGSHPNNEESKACSLHHSFFNNPLCEIEPTIELTKEILSFMEPT